MNSQIRHLAAILLAIIASRSLCAQTSELTGTGNTSNDAPATDTTLLTDEEQEWSSVFLMLDERPIHLQFRITINGVSLSQSRENGIQQLISRLDTDKDGKLSHDEFQKSPLIRKVARPKA